MYNVCMYVCMYLQWKPRSIYWEHYLRKIGKITIDPNGIKCDECGVHYKDEVISEIEEITEDGELNILHVCEYCQWKAIL